MKVKSFRVRASAALSNSERQGGIVQIVTDSRWTLTRALATAALLAGVQLLPLSASAQDKPVTFNLGAGPFWPSGEVGDRFDTGFTIPVGITANLTDTVGLQFEYMFARMNGPSATLSGTNDNGVPASIQLDTNHYMHTGTFNVVVGEQRARGAGGYAIGGLGFYRRSVQLTTPSVGFATVCDPWWWVCFPVAVPVTQIIGTRSSTDLGFNVGGGVTFGNFYAEVRYHYVRGPEFAVPAQLPLPGGQTGNVRATGHYLPVNFGVRF
jgi:opacity protein-like surface antigen